MGLVIKGTVKLMRLNRDGEIAFALTVHAGQNYGDTVALDRFERTHRAIAIGDTEIDFLSADALRKILEDEPAIVAALYRVAAHRLIVAVDMIDDMRMLKIEARLAKHLLTMIDQSGQAARIACLQEEPKFSTKAAELSKWRCTDFFEITMFLERRAADRLTYRSSA